MSTPSTLLADCRCTLGEGLLWDARAQAWLWTDIEGARMWRHDPATGATTSWRLPDRTGSFAICQSGQLLLGLSKGLAWGALDGSADAVDYTPIIPVEDDNPTTRINDGRTDRDGNFVFGTMSEAPGHPPTGHIYQFSQQHGLRRLPVGPVGIANSICFSADGATIYFCDSMTGRIMRGGYEAADARVHDIEPFVTVDPADGMPDGSVVDAEGTLWNAQWGGGVVRRYDPDGGLMAASDVPAQHVTCPAFGGPNLDILCATTARQGVTAETLEHQPHTGGVYRIAAHGATGFADRFFED